MSNSKQRHIKQSRSDDLYHVINDRNHCNRPKLLRSATQPTPGYISSSTHRLNNNYYSKIRFHRQSQRRRYKDYYLNYNSYSFPGDKIKNYTEFTKKYRFIMQNGNRKLLGYGAMSSVFKVYLTKNRNKKFAAKIASYRSDEQRRAIIKENRLLHKFGNGLEICDIYDDKLNQRMVFIQPYGKDLKTWWFGSNKNNGFKQKYFHHLSPKKQEIILKKIIYQILLCLQLIHKSGYIHHDIKPQNILVTKTLRLKYDEKQDDEQQEYEIDSDIDIINDYEFHIIDYGLTVPCKKGELLELNMDEIRFGTFGYNAWELMKYNQFRQYSHNIDLYSLGITICELLIGHHMLRHHDNFKKKQEIYCYQQLIQAYRDEEEYFFNENETFHGFTEYDVYAKTLRLKCSYWTIHFQRNNGISLSGDESQIRSIIINELQTKTSFTTRFKNFISNLIRDNPKKRILNVDQAINHDLFYNV